jgi:hypothetical protein
MILIGTDCHTPEGNYLNDVSRGCSACENGLWCFQYIPPLSQQVPQGYLDVGGHAYDISTNTRTYREPLF